MFKHQIVFHKKTRICHFFSIIFDCRLILLFACWYKETKEYTIFYQRSLQKHRMKKNSSFSSPSIQSVLYHGAPARVIRDSVTQVVLFIEVACFCDPSQERNSAIIPAIQINKKNYNVFIKTRFFQNFARHAIFGVNYKPPPPCSHSYFTCKRQRNGLFKTAPGSES